MIEQGDLQEFTSAVGRFSESADRLLRSGGTVANVNLNAGGAGLWLAVCCSVVMALVLAIVIPIGVGAFLFQQGQITKLQQGENAIRARFERDGQPLPPRTEGKKNE